MQTENSIFARLTELKLIVVTGKGGVGKSTLTSVLGRLFADAGRQTFLVEVDPRENLHQLLGVPPSGGDIVEVAPRLRVQHIEPRTILDDLVREKLKVDVVASKVLASPVHKHFTEGAPGLKEAAVFGRILRLLRGHTPRGIPTPDVVILDAPATGHGVSWLAAAQLVADVISSGPIGHLAAEVAAFLKDNQQSGVVVITTGEEMPVQETLELIHSMRIRLNQAPELVIANALYPTLPPEIPAEGEDPLFDLWYSRRQINDSELERLDEGWLGPLAELPILPIEPGPALVGRLSRYLKRELETGS
ncbi:MAG: ArsA family ATPase [Thermoanaerobaculales bacterium]|nr:ArsA family ATPase [Thermoanaerobaculales bacterium]